RVVDDVGDSAAVIFAENRKTEAVIVEHGRLARLEGGDPVAEVPAPLGHRPDVQVRPIREIPHANDPLTSTAFLRKPAQMQKRGGEGRENRVVVRIQRVRWEKLETRNSNDESNSKFETRMGENLHSGFGHSGLIRHLNFEFRISSSLSAPATRP